MTTIKVTCPECGDIDLTPLDLELSVAPSWATYSFTCCDCGNAVRKAADSEVVDLLSSAGVPTHMIPAEALEHHGGSALTYDDLLDFALALEDDEGILRNLGAAAAPTSAGRKRRRRRW